uniref:Uncharacterized protein n=1 Tax=Arundo donax TaxID=35708 RepID=A0A0A9CSK5_ARUDO
MNAQISKHVVHVREIPFFFIPKRMELHFRRWLTSCLIITQYKMLGVISAVCSLSLEKSKLHSEFLKIRTDSLKIFRVNFRIHGRFKNRHWTLLVIFVGAHW